jgi:hypothetical protein
MAHASSGRAITRDDRRTPAQWYCLLAGLSLLLAGMAGDRFERRAAPRGERMHR